MLQMVVGNQKYLREEGQPVLFLYLLPRADAFSARNSAESQWLASTSPNLNEEAAPEAVLIVLECLLMSCWKLQLRLQNKS